MVNRAFWQDKKVFLTGDTGFKGSWLRLWLEDMGAVVQGYSLGPTSEPNLHSIVGMPQTEYCLQEKELLFNRLMQFDPDYIIHMAAQALLPLSYEKPIRTFSANVMGTANLLEAARQCKNLKGILCITTDKVYKIPEGEPMIYFNEHDPLGGFDPYSVSKVCAEHIIKCYRDCFIKDVPIYVARAGNVIGGGDWAAGRLIPDIMRHKFESETPVPIRNLSAVRPWQHVFDVLCGYLMLLEQNPGKKDGWEWNFGPKDKYPLSVKDVIELLGAEYIAKEEPIHETEMLCLSSMKARTVLDWKTMQTGTALADVKDWYELYYTSTTDMKHYSLAMLYRYEDGFYFD